MSPAVDLGVLSRIAGVLTAAAEELDAGGATAPGQIDDGDLSGLVSAVLALLSESAAGLCEGLAAAGQGVQQCSRNYVDADTAAADAFDRLGR